MHIMFPEGVGRLGVIGIKLGFAEGCCTSHSLHVLGIGFAMVVNL
jgi:hypothetical protein